MTWRETVDSFYSEDIEAFYEQGLDRVLDESLAPRGPSTLFDMAGELGATKGARVLDLGSRDGRHLVELRERFECEVIGVEPAPANLGRMKRAYPSYSLRVARGVGEALPFATGVFDLVWVRDVLVHFESLDPAFAEIGLGVTLLDALADLDHQRLQRTEVLHHGGFEFGAVLGGVGPG